VSDDYTTTIYRDDQPPPFAESTDFGADFPWLFALPVIILIAAIIYLISLPAKKDEPKKTVREQINGAFDGITQEANLYDRKYVVGPLEKARKKVIEILDKEKVT
jgi:hypothetical protein